MLLSCEEAVKKFIPAVKAAVAKELYNTHHWDQVRIAKELGVTQAAVSKYLSGDYGKRVKNAECKAEVRNAAKKLARDVAVGGKGRAELARSICGCCAKFFSRNCVLTPAA